MIYKIINIDEQIDRIRFYEGKYGSPQDFRCYSYGRALKKYLQLPSFIPLYITMEHGVDPEDWCWPEMIDSSYPVFFNRSSLKDLLEKQYQKKSYVMSNPFVRWRAINNILQDNNANGTIFFPSHSTHLIDINYSLENYANQILALPNKYKPFSVCLYWKEFTEEIINIFKIRGINVFCAGHMADPLFIDNFYEIIKQFKYTSSNQIGSYTFYSVEMDIPFFLYGEPPFKINKGDPNTLSGNYLRNYNCEKYFLFDLVQENITDEVRIFVNKILGLDKKVNKNLLRFIIVKSLLKSVAKNNINRVMRFIHRRIPNLIENKIYLTFHLLNREDKIFTHLTSQEKILLYKTIKLKNEDLLCVEIGSYLGASTCFIAAAISVNSKLVCIDTWGNHAMKYVEIDTDAIERDTYSEFKKNTKKYRNKIIEIRKWSTKAIEDVKKISNNIDFLFIDGNHNYEGVKLDWDLYKAFLKDGSMVAFHDTGWAEGVQKVIREDVLQIGVLYKKLPNLEIYKIQNNY